MDLAPILKLLGQIFVIYAPAYAANMAPPLAASLHLPWGRPLSLRGFGPNKTWRGMLAGVIAAVCIAGVESVLKLGWYGSQPFSVALLGGFLMGVGAMAGDALKSAVKRRMHIRPGAPLILWDQVDFLLGASLFTMFLIPLPLNIVLAALVVTPFLHLFVNILAYLLNLKRVWW